MQQGQTLIDLPLCAVSVPLPSRQQEFSNHEYYYFTAIFLQNNLFFNPRVINGE